MKREFLLVVLILGLLPFVFSQGVSVTSRSLQSLVGPEDPISFELTIFNEQKDRDTFEVLLSVVEWNLSTEVKQIEIPAGGSAKMIVTLTPIGEKEFKVHNVPLTVASLDRDASVVHTLKVKVVEHPVLPRISFPETIVPGSNFIFNVDVENRRDSSVENLRVVLESSLFSSEETINLANGERKIVSFPVTFDQTTVVGSYPVFVYLYDGEELIAQTEDTFSILLREDVVIQENKIDGFLHSTIDVSATNNGNSMVTRTYSYTAGWFASLFLESNIKPSVVEDRAYTWEFTLSPGEELEILISFDYRLFAVVVLIVVLATLFIIIYTRKDIIVRKRVVSLGKNKDGTTRMRIVITVINKGFHRLSNVMVMDNVPAVAEVPKSFGTVEPTSVSKGASGNHIIWRINAIGVGEERVLSYVTNSKSKLQGRLIIPRAHVRYSKGNRNITVSSSSLQFFG